MLRLSELKLALDHPPEALLALIARTLDIAPGAIVSHTVYKRSFDARKADLRAVYIVDVQLTDAAREEALLATHQGNAHIQAAPDMRYRAPVQLAGLAAGLPRPVVVGFGPCGMFAALLLARMGLRPIVLERGKAVRERTQDTWGLWRQGVLEPESNVQFGEGGAGTFSDGKLYSQIRDPRFLGRMVMETFVQAGAPEEILYVAHPHIGTFKLVKVVENLRAEILALGGEIRFSQRVTDLLVEGDGTGATPRQLRGVITRAVQGGATTELRADHVVLALGHSARDTFEMLHARGVHIQAKPFSIGLRIEHPQSLIDRARWGRHAGHRLLGAADYRLVHHAGNGRSVYSFCMCPGGTVVAATSEPMRVVTNGMSQYSRSERNANAAIVVGIDPRDFPGDPPGDAALAGIALQRALESRAYELGGGNYRAPVQRVDDFIAGRPSNALGEVLPSYRPGVTPGDLRALLPAYATEAIREALGAFAQKINGFDRPDAVLTGVETRTSSPIRIPRGDDFQSLNLRGLYPAGEGAAYAGGILSASVDGIKVAEAVAQSIAREAERARTPD
ncbi:MAG: NAD(P)/FAD-dependent oxidoreductase [Burkholderiaceae bacterium]|jgi:uncharacterized FAD-dependent dehydrogenase|nr:NAD(P)/FAD-dependent oxidoreductase [Burkholderiaceae bacterium]